jgi:hypothetical protein
MAHDQPYNPNHTVSDMIINKNTELHSKWRKNPRDTSSTTEETSSQENYSWNKLFIHITDVMW